MSTDNIASNVGVICGACQAVNKPDAKFCNGCGQPLYEQCSGCTKQVLLTQKFCDHCGADLDSARVEMQKKHKDWMAEAVTAAREYRFDRSSRLLSKVTDNDDYRYADDVRNAKQAIEKVKTLQTQAESSVEEAL
ncbi:MAG: zinc ribbon domain-containing protein, partial [Planctomycetota bacterium]